MLPRARQFTYCGSHVSISSLYLRLMSSPCDVLTVPDSPPIMHWLAGRNRHRVYSILWEPSTRRKHVQGRDYPQFPARQSTSRMLRSRVALASDKGRSMNEIESL